MFKNNSYSQQACNYSFREDDCNKQNNFQLSNYVKKDKDCLMIKLEAIQKMMNRQYQIELQNRQMLKQQSESIAKIEKQLTKINKVLGNTGEVCEKSRMKSESMRSCRTKRSTEKSVLNAIQQRKKVINQELSRRINDQLDVKAQKKPLKFFLPVQQSLF